MGTPCASCLKNGNGLHEIKCQRESPFLSALTHQCKRYGPKSFPDANLCPDFEHSSSRRVVSFCVTLPTESLGDYAEEFVTIDGVGKISHTIKLPARRTGLRCFSKDLQSAIRSTEDSRKDSSSEADPTVVLLEEDKSLGTLLEQWALEYTSKYVHAAGPKFYSTTLVHILGTRYVKKGLPEV